MKSPNIYTYVFLSGFKFGQLLIYLIPTNKSKYYLTHEKFAPADKTKARILSKTIRILFIEYSPLFRMLCCFAITARYIRFASFVNKIY